MELAEISDRLELERVLHRYTVAIDSGNWDVLDTVFTPDARIDYTESGGISGAYTEVKDWLAQMLPMFPSRHHLLGQVVTTLHGDEATVLAYFYNPMVLPQQDKDDLIVEVGGNYHHTMVRTPDGWRSRRLYEEVVWKRGI